MILRRFILTLTLVICAPILAFSATSAENLAKKTVLNEISKIFADQSRFVSRLSLSSTFNVDVKKILKKAKFDVQPKTIFLENKAVKILVPARISENKVGVLFQTSADGKKIISYLPWYKNGTPLFTTSLEVWNKAKTANDVPQMQELVPTKLNYSAGIPVERQDVKSRYIIDFIDIIPSKTQEEHKEYTDKVGMKSTLGRRTASSKCLSYSASNASDWWNIVQGRKLGKHTSYVNGSVGYGMDPRAVESLYFKLPASPYTFRKVAGKDRVTGEKIPYSPKHFAYIMANIKTPSSVADHMKKTLKYKFPSHRFGMDLPFYTVFDRSKGNIKTITDALNKYGILLSQHTSRLFKDKVSLKLQGVHSVNIVGTGKLNGKPVALYYETFGKNHKEYLEDSFFGPRLRAFPVGFFYQGIAFPHKIRVATKLQKSSFLISFKNRYGQSIAPDAVLVKVNGKKINTQKNCKQVAIPLTSDSSRVEIRFKKKYFYTPEESEGYSRVYMISKGKIIELNEYAQVVQAIGKMKLGIIKKLLKKRKSYLDFLMHRANKLQGLMEKQLKTIKSDTTMVKMINDFVRSNPVLKKSGFARKIKAITKFK